MRFGLQANFDVLSLITNPATRWSVNLSPQVSAVSTRTKHLATGYDHDFDRQWHLGLGGQAAVGYRFTPNIGLQLYGGITCLTGDRFDNIPKYEHKSNLIWEAGLKLAYHFGKSSKATPAVQEPAVIAEPEPQPVVEQQPVMEENPAPVVEKPQPVAEPGSGCKPAQADCRQGPRQRLPHDHERGADLHPGNVHQVHYRAGQP
jgi:hypothetical protein